MTDCTPIYNVWRFGEDVLAAIGAATLISLSVYIAAYAMNRCVWSRR